MIFCSVIETFFDSALEIAMGGEVEERHAVSYYVGKYVCKH